MSKLSYHPSEIRWFDAGIAQPTFRKKGPCTICDSGEVYFSQLDKASYNRKVGPAVIYPDGTVTFNTARSQILGNLHRTDGPAFIDHNGNKKYVVHGKHLTSVEFFLKYNKT